MTPQESISFMQVWLDLLLNTWYCYCAVFLLLVVSKGLRQTCFLGEASCKLWRHHCVVLAPMLLQSKIPLFDWVQ